MVALPTEVQIGTQPGDKRRVDQLAQALCGCWVVSLSNGGVARLLGAIMGGDVREERQRRAAS